MSQPNPYLDKDGERLADVIRAIQAFSNVEPAAKTVQEMQDRLGKPRSSQTEGWEKVFRQHPEFFVVNPGGQENYVILQIRYSDRDHPLETSQTDTLIKTALELHNRAIMHRQEKRWWTSPIASLAVALIAVGGSYFGAVLGAKEKPRNSNAFTLPGVIEYRLPTNSGTIVVKDANSKPLFKVVIQKDNSLTFVKVGK